MTTAFLAAFQSLSEPQDQSHSEQGIAIRKKILIVLKCVVPLLKRQEKLQLKIKV